MLAPFRRGVRASGVARPVVVGLAGWAGIVAARHNALHAPAVVGVAIAIAALAVVVRERGAAVAAIGAAAAAAFATPAGLGPLRVVVGVAIATRPTFVDARFAVWSDVVDGLIALPAFAGLATSVASEPSQRGAVVAAATALAIVGTRLRPPTRPARASPVSFVGLAAGASLAFAPQLWLRLGELPEATRAAGRGLAAAFGVFVVVAVVEELFARRTGSVRRGRHAVRRGARRVAR